MILIILFSRTPARFHESQHEELCLSNPPVRPLPATTRGQGPCQSHPAWHGLLLLLCHPAPRHQEHRTRARLSPSVEEFAPKSGFPSIKPADEEHFPLSYQPDCSRWSKGMDNCSSFHVITPVGWCGFAMKQERQHAPDTVSPVSSLSTRGAVEVLKTSQK